MNVTLEIRLANFINMVTNDIGIMSDNHKIWIVMIDLMGDDRSRAPSADPRRMTIVGVRRKLLVRSAAVKDTRRTSVLRVICLYRDA